MPDLSFSFVDLSAGSLVSGHLPDWVSWLYAASRAVIVFVVAALAAALAQRVALGPLLRLPADAHWTERARLAFPARRVAAFNTFFIPVFFSFGVVFGLIDATLLPPSALIAICVLASVAGVRFGHRRLRAVLSGEGAAPRLAARLRGSLAALLVLYPAIVVALAFAIVAPQRLDAWAAFWAIAFAVTLHLLIRGAGVSLALRLGVVRAARPEVARMIDDLAVTMGQAPVRSFEVDMPMANAFALPQARLVGVTTSIIDRLSLAELRAICAHEMGHIAETKAMIRARSGLLWVVYLLIVGSHLMSFFQVALMTQAAVLGAFVLLKVTILGRALRHAESLADSAAKANEGEAGTFARALETLYRVNRMPAMMPGQGGSHPHLYDRMLASGVTPSFPRPAPPPVKRGQWAQVVVVATLLLAVVTAESATILAAEPAPDWNEQLVGAGLLGLRGARLPHLARVAGDEGRREAAAALWSAAADRDPWVIGAQLEASLAQAGRGDCEASARYLARAQRLRQRPAAQGELYAISFEVTAALVDGCHQRREQPLAH